MSLDYLALVPHPPIAIPEIGRGHLSEINQTVKSLKKIAQNFNRLNIDTAVFISPHALLSSLAMTICVPRSFRGDFSDFEHKEVFVSCPSDIDLASKIILESNFAQLPVTTENSGILDHGVMVPLYYLTKFSDSAFAMVEIGYSSLPIQEHLLFGEVIGRVVNQVDKRVALIASGDLSHRHLDHYYKQYARDFDQTIVDFVSTGSLEGIEQIDPELVELAGECGYRSLLIACGVLRNFDIKLKLLSYENPFGVGYLTAESA